MIQRLVIATHNQGKLREFAALLGTFVPDIVSAGSLGLAAPEETGATFAANAVLKAKTCADATGCAALADDSGLCVTALGGRPGIYSARWADASGGFDAAMRRINDELATSPDRSAYFICALALVWPDGRAETVEGRIDGQIAAAPRGANGHGYDPIFIPDGYDATFADMADADKNAISHRGRAVKALIDRVFAAF